MRAPLFCLCFLMPCLVTTQGTLQFQRLADADGPGHRFVRAALQDHLGFLWIGTVDGLYRYDGYQFQTFRHDPDDAGSLSDNSIVALLEDSDTSLWISTQNGLNRLNRTTGKFERFLHDPRDPASLVYNSLNDLCEDRQGRLWIGTWGKGLEQLDRATGKFKHFKSDPEDSLSLSHDFIIDIHEDREGRLWVATYGGGLNLLKPTTNSFQRFRHDPRRPRSLPHDILWRVNEDRQGDLWVATWGRGIARFDFDNQSFIPIQHDPNDPNSLSIDVTSGILEDCSGVFWISTVGGGLNRWDPNLRQFARFRHDPEDPASLSDDVVEPVLEDRQGNLWIGSYSGLNYLDRTSQQFSRYRHDDQNPHSLSGNQVTSFLEDRQGMLWVGTTEGLNRLDRSTGRFEHFRHDPQDRHSISGDYVTALFEDQQGALWVGTWSSGLNRLDRSTGKFERFGYNSKNRHSLSITGVIWTILEGREGSLWIGTAGEGMYRLNPENGKPRHFMHDPEDTNSISHNDIWSICMDRQGDLWIGSSGGGLDRLNPATGKFDHFRADSRKPGAISDNRIKYIREDRQGTLWIATLGGGLNRWERSTGRFEHFREKDGLANDIIYRIEEDTQGNLWMNTATGLSKFDPRTNVFQTVEDGLRKNPFVHASYLSPRSGELFVGGQNGFIAFYPDQLHTKGDTLFAPLSFTALTRQNRRGDKPGLDLFFGRTGSLKLSHQDFAVTLQFAALSLRPNAKTHYKYQLAGLSDQWYELGERREVTFNNLPAGRYTLRVTATNAAGAWNPRPLELAITMLPPWWRTGWAYTGYAILILLALLGLRRYELRRYGALAEARQLKELDAFKTSFYTNITHEFRTPLTIIQGLSEQAIEENGHLLPEKNLENAKMVRRNSAQLLTLVNQMLDLHKLEVGALPVHLQQGDIVRYLNYLTESFHSYAENRHVGLHFISEPRELIMDYDAEKLLHIVSNLLSNAIKFTPPGGNVYFSVDITGTPPTEWLQLRVRDSGVGIAEEQLPYIFDRFYQADQTPTRKGEGAGIGLALTRELVKLLGGTISVQSQVGKGTTFTVSLPISRQAPVVEGAGPAKEQVLGFTAAERLPVGIPVERPAEEDQPLALIIEDNPDMVRYLSACLEKDYQITTAYNGKTGVEVALELIPDIIVCDVMMPEKDGYEVTQILKNDERTSHIPIILLTAKADQNSRITGLRSGADAYLAKPFHREELQVRLEQLIESRKKMQERYGRLAPPTAEAERPTLEDAFLQKVRQAVEDHLDDPSFDIVRLSQALCLSRSQLFRKLKALTDQSPSRIVRSIRLQKAKELLETTELNVSEVAYAVGFSDLSYFSKCFREEYGEQPRAVGR